MNWSELQQSVNIASTFTSLVQAGAVIAGAVVAIRGISAWRREVLGRKRIELAEKGAILFTRSREAIKSIRKTFIPMGELEAVYRVRNPAEGQVNLQQLGAQALQYYVTIDRIKTHNDLFAEFDQVRPLFVAYFGDDCQGWFTAYFSAVNKISVNASTLIRMELRGDGGAEPRTTAQFQATIWNDDEADELGQSVKAAYDSAFARCTRVLRTFR